MIIRATDKSGFVNLKNIDSVCLLDTIQNRRDCIAISFYHGDSKTTLGIYSTEEKAIKVLDMICEQYQYCQECKCGLVGINKPDFVFQMPQDSEV